MPPPTNESADERTCDIAVIGAGAAGLTAAIFAAQSGAHVIALEGAPRIGAKILISGGGRCNVTHDVVTPDDFNGGSRNAIAKVLRTFTVEETLRWFVSMGVNLKREETGKLFPTTDRARTVIDALVSTCRAELLTGQRVSHISPGFVVHTNRGSIRARAVILATGGRSVPKTGSDGHGYTIARDLGHSVTHTFPALVPLLMSSPLSDLSGTSADVELSVVAGKVLRRERGSMLFTHFGLSGPVVLDISRHWIANPGSQLLANFLPGETFESLEAALLANDNPRATMASLLRGRLPERLLAMLAPPGPLSMLTKDVRRASIRSLVEHPLRIARDRGFDYAEVTAGGVPLAEVDVATMASRKCERLYLCGEILDVDGRIGGYNFQWAWATGRLAGMSAAASVHSR
jgi:predicted Rossmann fold flavoprotein